MNIEELVKAAAAATGMTGEMVHRSAEARAEKEGMSVEEVLAQWGGIDLATGERLSAGSIGADDDDEAAEDTMAEEPAPKPAAEKSKPAAEPQTTPAPASEPAAPAASGAGMSEEDLAKAAAEKMGMSESMVKRSAGARGKAEGKTAIEVMAEWAGVDPATVGAAAAAPAAAPASAPAAAEAPAAETPAPAASAGSGGGMSADEVLAAAAKAQGLPESMVKRSAAARAKAEGKTAEQVMAEWAGIDPSQVSAAAPGASSAGSASAPAAAAPAEAELEVEVIGEEPPADAPAPKAAPAPKEPEPEVVPVGAIPRWLVTLFVVVPLFALAYAAFLPNGPNCGDAGRLAVDPVTGEVVNCDGSAFGSTDVDYFAIGEQVYESAGCVACHGPGGAGAGSFPAFTEGRLLMTFPEGQCATHIEWVTLGTNGWPDATYGATDKPVGGSGAVMPGFGASLTDQELASVALYERVAFGGQELAAAQADCIPGDTEASAAGE